MTDSERVEWLIKTLAARDFDIPEFHALQTEIAAKWKADRADLAAAKALLREALPNCFWDSAVWARIHAFLEE